MSVLRRVTVRRFNTTRVRAMGSVGCMRIVRVLVGIFLAGAARGEWIETTTRDGVFHVVGHSFDATQTVAGIAAEMAGLGMSYFPFESHWEAVTVELRPVSHGQSAELPPFSILPEAGNRVRITIHWNDSRTFEEVCQALASGFLRQVAHAQHGPQAYAHTPSWLEFAFGQLLQARLRPAYIDEQGRGAEVIQRLRLDEILQAEGPFDPVAMQTLGLNAVWLFRLLESQTSPRRLLREGLLFMLGGGAPVHALENMIAAEMANPAERELWWAVGFAQMVRGQSSPVYDMERSRDLIRRMAVLTAAIEGGDRRLSGAALWLHRDKESVRLALALSLQELKLEIQKINPVYYNALLSLGLYLEVLLEAEVDEDRVGDYLQAFERDLRAAYRLELAIRRLLHW